MHCITTVNTGGGAMVFYCMPVSKEYWMESTLSDWGPGSHNTLWTCSMDWSHFVLCVWWNVGLSASLFALLGSHASRSMWIKPAMKSAVWLFVYDSVEHINALPTRNPHCSKTVFLSQKCRYHQLYLWWCLVVLMGIQVPPGHHLPPAHEPWTSACPALILKTWLNSGWRISLAGKAPKHFHGWENSPFLWLVFAALHLASQPKCSL